MRGTSFAVSAAQPVPVTVNKAGLALRPVSLSGCADSRQGSRGVRAGAARVPAQGAGAGARARDETAFALRSAGGGKEDQEPSRAATKNPLGTSFSPPTPAPSPQGGRGKSRPRYNSRRSGTMGEGGQPCPFPTPE